MFIAIELLIILNFITVMVPGQVNSAVESIAMGSVGSLK